MPPTTNPTTVINQATPQYTYPPPLPPMAAVATVPMPAKGHSTAPKFSADQPRELRQYFEELDNLFTGAAITDDQIKKSQACRYLDFESADLWQNIPSFTAGSTYDNWKEELYKLYPGAEADKKYTVADMDKLVGERYRAGIYTLEDLASYYRSFFAVTKFLIEKGHLTEKEQNQAFIRGFQAALLDKIQRRLEIKVPDHNVRDAYKMSDVHSAAAHILEGAAVNAFPSLGLQPIAPVQSGIKSEDLNAILDKFSQTIISALAAKSYPTAHSSNSQEHTHDHRPGRMCHGCGQIGHFIQQCPVIEAAITAGKC